jgi:hypothetical protein
MDNPNEAITNIAMPERRIPVLVRSASGKRDGLVHVLFYPPPTHSIDIFGPADVRRIPQTALKMFVDPEQRKTFEKKYGPIHESWYKKLLYLLKLADVIGRREKGLRQCVAEGLGTGYIRERAIRDPMRELGEQLNMGIYKALFVIWWAEHEKKFAPGLYCPDMPTALYALALSAIGEAGAVGVCRHCGKPFIRSRGKQSYCNHKCQVAAGMVRYRKRLAKGRTKKSRNRR